MKAFSISIMLPATIMKFIRHYTDSIPGFKSLHFSCGKDCIYIDYVGIKRGCEGVIHLKIYKNEAVFPTLQYKLIVFWDTEIIVGKKVLWCAAGRCTDQVDYNNGFNFTYGKCQSTFSLTPLFVVKKVAHEFYKILENSESIRL